MEVDWVQFIHSIYDVPVLDSPDFGVLGCSLIELEVHVYCEELLHGTTEQPSHALGYNLGLGDCSQVNEGNVKLIKL
jgi:hypothetical protein